MKITRTRSQSKFASGYPRLLKLTIDVKQTERRGKKNEQQYLRNKEKRFYTEVELMTVCEVIERERSNVDFLFLVCSNT